MGDGLALLTCIPEMMRAMSDFPTDLPDSRPPPPQRCAVYTRVSMDNAEDDKLSSVSRIGVRDPLKRAFVHVEHVCIVQNPHKQGN